MPFSILTAVSIPDCRFFEIFKKVQPTTSKIRFIG